MERKRAIEILRKEYDPRGCDETLRKALETLIPELRESEDERMCTRCIELLRKVSAYSGEEYLGVEIADCIIWLQALRKNLKEPVVDKEGMYYYLGGEFIYCGYPATEENPYDFAISQQEKQKESLHIPETCKENPDSFTDKDEKMLERVVESLTCYRSKVYDEGEGELAREIDEEIDWVQAWKEQKKPNAKSPSSFGDEETIAYHFGLEEGIRREREKQKEQKPVDRFSLSACGKECVIIPKEEYEALKKPEERFEEAREKYQVEWSEEDIENGSYISAFLQANCENNEILKKATTWFMSRFKSLRPQPRQEWSEEEKDVLRDAICAADILAKDFKKDNPNLAKKLKVAKEWLESLPDRFSLSIKQEWDEFDEDCLKRAIWYVENPAPSVIKDFRLTLWLNTLRYRFSFKPQPKVEWSEEDMTMLNNLIWSVHMKSISPLDEMDDRGKYERYENFLRSFPKRFSPQPKQEWTEEEKQKLNRIYSIIGWAMDEHAFSSCKKLIGDKEGVELQDFLRSVAKPEQQSQWKPSEEQMEALKCAIADVAKFSKRGGRQVELENEPYYSALHSLYCNLEKLM